MSNIRYGLRILNGTIYERLMQSSAFYGVLDFYGDYISSAYSLKKLSNNYTGSCIRVRRSSDNSELDIGFVGYDLDTSTLLSFCGAGSGFITTWYDQSGNSYNVASGTLTAQPRIVLTGSLETVNGNPAVLYDGIDDVLLTVNPSANAITTGKLYGFSVASILALNSCLYGKNTSSVVSNRYTLGYGTSAAFGGSGTGIKSSVVDSGNIPSSSTSTVVGDFSGQKLYSQALHTTNDLYVNLNMRNSTSMTNSLGGGSHMFAIGRAGSNTTLRMTGHIQEVLIFNGDKSSELTSIQNFIMNIYGIS